MAGQTFFLVIEGIDGSGKSSITRRLVKVLEATLGRHVKLTFEPHDPSCAGLFIRQVLMKKVANIPARTLALAFAVNRADHCDREISPFLELVNGKNRVVVCDRYYLSSLVYQKCHDLGYEEIMALNASARKPDLTIFLTASTRTCYERMRNRGESKELFETNLNETKKKYFDAIDFLSKHGEKIISVEAEGSMPEVFDRVINALFENCPEWLRVQYDLPFEDIQHVFEPTDITIEKIANKISSHYYQNLQSDSATNNIDDLRDYIYKYVDNLKYNDIATLFLDAIRVSGYSLHDKLPWTDIDAYELSIDLPLSVSQRGTALLLGESQRYDAVMTKFLSSQKNTAIANMSDFLFIFDSNPSHLIINYYERERIIDGQYSFLSPALNIIGRPELSDVILNKIIESHIGNTH